MTKTRVGLLMGVLAAGLMVGSHRAEARSPLPFFRGVERLVVFCGRPADSGQRAKLCAIAQQVLEELTGATVALGTGGLSDAAAITVLVNGYPVDGPNGPVFVIDIDLLRKGQADQQLFGAPPVLVAAKGLLTAPEEVASGLRRQLAERVVDPWRLAVPAGRTGMGSSRG